MLLDHLSTKNARIRVRVMNRCTTQGFSPFLPRSYYFLVGREAAVVYIKQLVGSIMMRFQRGSTHFSKSECLLAALELSPVYLMNSQYHIILNVFIQNIARLRSCFAMWRNFS
jgi:hypothetical protein